MSNTHPRWFLTGFLCALVLVMPSRLSAGTDLSRQLLESARKKESRGNWLEACQLFDEVLRSDRTNLEARKGYQRCVRRFHIRQRHKDPEYRSSLSKLTPTQSLDVYSQVLDVLTVAYVDSARVSLSQLVREGVQELRWAFEEPEFLKNHARGVSSTTLRSVRRKLKAFLVGAVDDRGQAREQLVKVLQVLSRAGIAVESSLTIAVAFEFVCGACNSLDEYSLFLAPGYKSAWKDRLANAKVGIGIGLARIDGSLVIDRVYPKSPAEEAGLLVEDQVIRIDRQPVEMMTEEMTAERLQGKVGTTVELEIISPGESAPRVFRVERRSFRIPSVEHRILSSPMMDSEILGLLRINHFRASTVQEVKEAIANLRTQGAQGIILDLRGNPGGLFESALDVAELFLDAEVIAHTRSRLRPYNRAHRGEGSHPLRLPVVVLVDSLTASSAEVVAGAFKEHGRAHLIGEPTFGKGSIQRTVTLDKAPLQDLPAGIRLTIATIFSPSNQPYNGQGITPHELVDPTSEAILTTATLYLQSVLRMSMVR